MRTFLYKHLLLITVVIATVCSIIGFIYYYHLGLIVQYNDSASHLDIARRIIDSLTPSFVQIGSTWLPLLHILILPFVANDFLWKTGIAGSFISMPSYIFSAIGIFKIIEDISDDKVAAFIGALAFILNANMLYMQTTPMFEPLLIVTFIWSMYFLLKWSRNMQIGYLLLTAFFVLLATLTRYDGWFLFLGVVALVFGISWQKNGYQYAEGKVLLFSVLGGFGMFLWLLYNQLIFGSFLYFAFNQYSAHSQQLLLEQMHQLPTKHNIILSFLIYGETVIYNCGLLLTILAILGLGYVLLTKKSNVVKIILLALLIPFVFNILALEQGHSVIWLPNLPPFNNTFFNVRYGILMVPVIAIFVGILSEKKTIVKILVTVLILLQGITFYMNNSFAFSSNNIVLFRDSLGGRSFVKNETSQWIHSNCADGLTLISSASNEAIIFHSGLSLKHYITEGTGSYWTKSLEHPSTFAKCIVISHSALDGVRKAILKNANFYQTFAFANSFDSLDVYIRLDNQYIRVTDQ